MPKQAYHTRVRVPNDIIPYEIAHLSIVANVVNKMVLNRIQPMIDGHLRRNQNGFRPG